MPYTIYCIRNLLNGKQYIGQTKQPPTARWGQHKCDGDRRSHSALHAALKKYGSDQFSFEALLRAAHAAFMRAVMSQPDEVNKRRTANLGKQRSPSTCAKISAAHSTAAMRAQNHWP